MAGLLTVDGINYNLHIKSGELQRTADILDGKNAGRVTSGVMTLDTIGTFINYQLTFLRDRQNVDEYDALFEVLSDPKQRQHEIIIPYGQGWLTYDVYAAGVGDALYKRRGDVAYWNNMTAKFKAISATKTP